MNTFSNIESVLLSILFHLQMDQRFEVDLVEADLMQDNVSTYLNVSKPETPATCNCWV